MEAILERKGRELRASFLQFFDIQGVGKESLEELLQHQD
jgi:hypothetical protein